ncbi:hypothetical protein BDF19DRAFT_455755 [Syncephalis fuscata]|nr:hypothetical protein BDF19DRAFT_455755 [Syncephalis fuscata]
MAHKNTKPSKRFLLPHASKELRHLLVRPESSICILGGDTNCDAPMFADTTIDGLQTHQAILHCYGRCNCTTNTAYDNSTSTTSGDDTASDTKLVWNSTSSSAIELRSYYAAITSLDCLLASPARSGYFRAMLSVDDRYIESSLGQFHLPDSCVPARALPYMIHFLYTGSSVASAEKEATLTLADWTAIWRAADFLDFPSLHSYCLHRIVHRLHGLRCICDTCVPQIPGLLSFSERYNLTALTKGCNYVLTHGYNRAWLSANFVNRLSKEKRDEILQLVLENLKWQLSERKAIAGASNSSQWMSQVHLMNDEIYSRAIECAAKEFSGCLTTDKDLPKLLVGWNAEIIKEWLDAMLSLSGRERDKLVIYMEIKKLIVKRQNVAFKMLNNIIFFSSQLTTEILFATTVPTNLNQSITNDQPIKQENGQWPSIAANNGFAWLPNDVVQELAEVIGVQEQDLVDNSKQKMSSNNRIRTKVRHQVQRNK